MLTIFVPAKEVWDESREQFITTNACTLQLEHSLVSLSKWESKWCKAFLSEFVEKTDEEAIDYIRCMTINHVPSDVYYALSQDDIQKISDYINAPMTATTFSDQQKRGPKNRDVVTSELIYYWMVALQIPFECQKWHLNRLLTLIQVCNIKNQPPKKMKKADILSRNASLNAARRAKMGTKG